MPCQTAACWDVAVTPEAITEAKIKGDANNDWVREYRSPQDRFYYRRILTVVRYFPSLTEQPTARQHKLLLFLLLLNSSYYFCFVVFVLAVGIDVIDFVVFRPRHSPPPPGYHVV